MRDVGLEHEGIVLEMVSNCLDERIPHDGCSHRCMASGHSLRQNDYVWNHTVVLEREHRPRPPKAGLYLVDHEDGVSSVTDRSQLGEISVRRHRDEPPPEHRPG